MNTQVRTSKGIITLSNDESAEHEAEVSKNNAVMQAVLASAESAISLDDAIKGIIDHLDGVPGALEGIRGRKIG